jgi:serine/threonine protein kinase
MGEVYKARDPRLDRTVAIKVVPVHVASDSNVRQRFEREARAVTTLRRCVTGSRLLIPSTRLTVRASFIAT